MEKDGHKWVDDLKNWQVFNITDEYDTYAAMDFRPLDMCMHREERLPRGVYRATFNVSKPSDTFLDFESWGKGLVYVNGHALGRIWETGPQQTLYMPGCWLKKGANEILVFDILGPRKAQSRGLKEPQLDRLRLDKVRTHSAESSNLDLSAETPVMTSAFAPGNGWQEVKFNAPVRGRYICLEALDALDGKEKAAIAEFYLLDDKGVRLSREPWTVVYADSEDTEGGNRTADKVFDLQESTYWQTAAGVPFPHAVVIDLGAMHTLSGLQYLPRMESAAPASIGNFRIYVKETDFNF